MTLHAARFDPAAALPASPALEQPYLDLLREVLETGVERADRTGVGVRGVFGRQMRFDLRAGFPLLTTKRVHFRSVVLDQRSADLFLGVPFNIASYALLTHMVAQAVGLEVGDFVHVLGDAHLYLNHLEQARLQLSRAPRPAPRLRLAPRPTLDAYEEGDVSLEGYDPHPAIRAPVAV